MSVGLLLLRAVIDAGSRNTFNQLIPELFVGDEIVAYEFVSSHYRQYGRLPGLETLQSRGIPLADLEAIEPVEYYFDRCRTRAKGMILFSSVGRVNPLLDNRDVDGAIRELQLSIADAMRMDVSTHSTNIGAQATSLVEYSLAHRFSDIQQGIPFGYDILDRITEGGMQPGDLIIVVARPNIGKSWMLLKMLQGAWRANHPCLFASMEMSLPAITRRFIGLETGINPNVFRNGRMSHFAYDMLIESQQNLHSGVPINLLCGSNVSTVSQIDAMIQQHTPDVAYIDSGYLLQPEKKRKGSDSRRETISDVIEELKGVATRRNIPIVSTVQFNREVNRNNKKNNLDLAQIAETDVIGRTASVIVGMTGQGNKRTFEVMKNRDGRVGDKFTINFGFSPVDMSFSHEGGIEETQGETIPTDVSWMGNGRAL